MNKLGATPSVGDVEAGKPEVECFHRLQSTVAVREIELEPINSEVLPELTHLKIEGVSENPTITPDDGAPFGTDW